MNDVITKKKPLRTLNMLLTFTLICLFALLSILLVVLGAQAYGNITKSTQRSFEIRTSLGYIQGKLRASDGLGTISIDKIDGNCLLMLENEIDGEKYKTLIYCYQGALYEMLTAAETAFYPDQGNVLTSIQSFDIETTANGYLINIIDTSNTRYSQFVVRHST